MTNENALKSLVTLATSAALQTYPMRWCQAMVTNRLIRTLHLL